MSGSEREMHASVDEHLWTVALEHSASCEGDVVLIEGEGWLCSTHDEDFGEMLNWAESVGRTIRKEVV